MLRIRFTALSLLLGAALFAPPPLFAQTVTDSYVAGTGNDSITVKHLLKAVLVGNNNSTNDTAQLLSNFVVVGNENTIGTAAVVLGNNNAQTSLIPDTASASVQVGRDNAIEGETNTQLGLFNRTKGVSNATTGMSNVVEGDYNLVTGNVTRVTGTGNAVTGWGGQVDGSMNVKNGPGGAIRGDNNVTVGNSVEITGNNQVVIGLSARGFADGCVAIGSNSQCFESNEFSVGLINNERRVTNVAPGLRSADAANVGQLRSVALAYGAGADVINGVFVAPLIEFRNGASYTNVADALYDLDGRVTSGGSSGPGPRGADGLSAYEVALANGFQGNESDWLASLKGESGAPGAPGSGSGSTVKGGANVEVTTNTDGTQTVAVSDNVQLSDAGSVSVGATTVNAQGVSIEGGGFSDHRRDQRGKPARDQRSSGPGRATLDGRGQRRPTLGCPAGVERPVDRYRPPLAPPGPPHQCAGSPARGDEPNGYGRGAERRNGGGPSQPQRRRRILRRRGGGEHRLGGPRL